MEITKNMNMAEKYSSYIELIKNHMSTYRWTHSLGVAKAAQELAEFWGENPEKAWLAGIFHDYAREIPTDELIKIALEYHLPLLKEDRANPVVLHAPVGAFLIKKELGVNDPEILSAITKHTVGGETLTLLDKIIFLADMIEENRDWPGVEKLREIVYQDIDYTLKEAIEGTMDYLREKGQKIHPLTLVTYNSLKGEKNLTSHDIALICASAAEKKRAKNIVIMDLQGISIIADYFVICTGSNSNQLRAICDQIGETLDTEGVKPPLRIEGLKDARWILMDFGGVVVHIFQEEERLYYNLERLWGDAKFTYYKEQD